MTRETKIGLLVGLAFVIVIGILLSDHITRSMQPPQAALAVTGDNVNSSTTSPGVGRAATAPDVRVPAELAPIHQVRTRVDNQAASAIVNVGPRPGPNPISDTPPSRGSANDDPAAGSLIRPDNPGAGATTPSDDLVKPANTKDYVAEAGDTLKKIARKALGKDTQANRDAIVKANPSLQANPNKIIAGHTYLIPVADAAAAGHDETASAHGPATPPGGTVVIYTTKPGDSLWKIAQEQVGSGSAVGQIREMNKDVLKNGDSIKPQMKLKLPPKQVASAN